MTTTISSTAPVKARAVIAIDAPPHAVWRVISDIAHWPRWNTDVKAVSIDGPVRPGTAFRWKAGPGTITSTLTEVVPDELIAWTGRTMGIDAIHIWRITPGDRGGSVLTTEESWEGPLVSVLRPLMQRVLARALDKGLRDVRAASAAQAS